MTVESESDEAAGAAVDSQLASRLQRARFVVFWMGLFIVGLVGIVVYAAASGRLTAMLDDEATREAAVAELVRQGAGIWDSFPDPDVVRTLQPNLRARPFRDETIDSNSLGLREQEIAIPKPPGRIRVVVLGDSFVFGPGVEMNERLGAHLEAELQRRAGISNRDIEVLHVGLGSWNILAETSFMRRALSLLAPDLVIHVLVHNDLDDVGGVRGFGSVGSTSPQSPAQLATFFVTSSVRVLSGSGLSYLNAGLSHESRERYARARRAISELAGALSRTGVEYLVCMFWQDHTPTARRLMLDGLDVPTVFLSSDFRAVQAYRIGPGDPHWTVEGHRAVARFLYGAILEFELLQAMRPQDWPQASEFFDEEDGRGRAEAADPTRVDPPELAREIRFDVLDPEAARQVYGGISAQGAVGPVGVVLLPAGSAIRVVGRVPERPEMAGATVTLSIDGVVVDEIELDPGRRIDLTVQVPPELAARDAIELRFDASDFVYAGANLREPLAILIERIISVQ